MPSAGGSGDGRWLGIQAFPMACAEKGVDAGARPRHDVPPSGTGPFTAEANPNLGLPLLGGFLGTIKGYVPGDAIIVDVLQAASLVENGALVDVMANSHTLGWLTFDNATNAAAALANDAIVLSVTCFAAGTRIATERGEVPVETIRVGERVPTVLGGALAEVVWIGVREVDCARHPKPGNVWPVRVRAGAFGAGVPHTDLWLSPDHAIYVNEVLVPVKLLVNGGSIAQVPADHITYYHLELPRHDVVLAEGLAVESYLETGERSNFANGPGPMRLYPDFSARLWDAYGCAPLVVTGAQLARAWERVVRIAVTELAVA
jgi:hypothetical protein